MSTHAWHRFVPSSDDDNECANTDCGLIVCDSTLQRITIPCPAPPCGDDGNGDGRCVMVPGPKGPECSYCDRKGSYVEADEDEDDAALAELLGVGPVT